MNITDQLRKLGFKPDQIDGALVDGKPLSDVKDQPKRSDGWPQYRSKTEAIYAMLLRDQLLDGEIRRFEYEALTFTLAASDKGRGARFTPDFVCWLSSGVLELREIKGGFVRESARVRFLVAKRLYPEFSWRMIQRKNGTWNDIL